MKVLSVQQPWASLIVAGIKKVENRSWQPKVVPGRILIHASKKTSLRSMGSEPIEWVHEILNHQIYGNLADFDQLPSNAIVGYVTFDCIDKDNANSVWAAGESNEEKLFYWHVKDAYVFDEPITNIKGKLWLWNYDLDEDNLPPAHKVEVNFPTLKGKEVIIPLNEKIWKELEPNKSLALELGTLADDLCLPESFELKPMKTITFTHKGKKRTFELRPETEAQYYTDGSEAQNPEMYLSILEPEGAMRWVAYFVWGKEIS